MKNRINLSAHCAYSHCLWHTIYTHTHTHTHTTHTHTHTHTRIH